MRITQQSHHTEVTPRLSRWPVKNLIVKMRSLTHIPATHTQTHMGQASYWLPKFQIVLTYPSMHLIRQTIATFAIKLLWYHNFYHELGCRSRLTQLSRKPPHTRRLRLLGVAVFGYILSALRKTPSIKLTILLFFQLIVSLLRDFLPAYKGPGPG